MSQRYYVYMYLDPRHAPPEPMYVGKGHGDRVFAHLSWTHNPWLRRKIQRIREAGLEPLIEIVEDNLTSEEALHEEQEMITEIGRADLGAGPLCNFTDGGEGTTGWVPSESTRHLWSEQRRGPQTPAQYAANCQRRHTDTAKRKISKANRGRSLSEEHIEAIREYNRTRPITDEMRAKWSATRKAMGISQEHQRKMQAGKERARAARTPEEQAAIAEKGAQKNRGQRRSEETKRKMRQAWEQRRAKWGPSGQPPQGVGVTWRWPLWCGPAGLPDEPGRFGAVRRHDVHTGVDLYTYAGMPVLAVEGGVVVAVEKFTGPDAGSPWWNDTEAVLVEGASGVVCYGEIAAREEIVVGARVQREYCVGCVKTVLRKDKGRPMAMLHLELYTHGTRGTVWWRLDEPRPPSLLDPTRRLADALEAMKGVV